MELTESEFSEIDIYLGKISAAKTNFLFVPINEIVSKMILLRLVKIVMEYNSDKPPITFTEKGFDVFVSGSGYKKYLAEIRRKENRNRRIALWTLITSIIAIILILWQILISYQHKP